MKKIIVIVSLIVFSSFVKAQHQDAQLLKQPAKWEFERFSLPPAFAPGFPYSGVEELRFSPGMFKKDSAAYFTYAFVAELDNRNSFSQDDIKNYLFQYFMGLCISTAKQKKLFIDTSKISAAVDKGRVVEKNTYYNAVVNIFGVFADGKPVALNLEIKVINNKSASKVYLVFIASPLNKTNNIWKDLRKIQETFIMP